MQSDFGCGDEHTLPEPHYSVGISRHLQDSDNFVYIGNLVMCWFSLAVAISH